MHEILTNTQSVILDREDAFVKCMLCGDSDPRPVRIDACQCGNAFYVVGNDSGSEGKKCPHCDCVVL